MRPSNKSFFFQRYFGIKISVSVQFDSTNFVRKEIKRRIKRKTTRLRNISHLIYFEFLRRRRRRRRHQIGVVDCSCGPSFICYTSRFRSAASQWPPLSTYTHTHTHTHTHARAQKKKVSNILLFAGFFWVRVCSMVGGWFLFIFFLPWILWCFFLGGGFNKKEVADIGPRANENSQKNVASWNFRL